MILPEHRLRCRAILLSLSDVVPLPLRKLPWNQVNESEVSRWEDFVGLAQSQSYLVRGNVRPDLFVVADEHMGDAVTTRLSFHRPRSDADLLVYANLHQLLEDLNSEAMRLHVVVLQVD